MKDGITLPCPYLLNFLKFLISNPTVLTFVSRELVMPLWHPMIPHLAHDAYHIPYLSSAFSLDLGLEPVAHLLSNYAPCKDSNLVVLP